MFQTLLLKVFAAPQEEHAQSNEDHKRQQPDYYLNSITMHYSSP